MAYQIDLNSDMGESFGAYKIGGDEEIIKYVTSANVACGFHAGDPMVMDATVKAAAARGVAVGAHPGYPDLLGFGRRKMVLKPIEVKNYMKYQIGALQAFLAGHGMKLQHVAPHGALGNLCQYDREVSRAICEAVCEIDKSIMIYYCAGAVLGEITVSLGDVVYATVPLVAQNDVAASRLLVFRHTVLEFVGRREVQIGAVALVVLIIVVLILVKSSGRRRRRYGRSGGAYHRRNYRGRRR